MEVVNGDSETTDGEDLLPIFGFEEAQMSYADVKRVALDLRGGDNSEECLRTAVETFEENWDAVIAELLSPRTTDDTIIRTTGIGYTPRVDEVFETFVEEVNRHVATTAANNDVPCAQPYLGEEYISPDGVRPDDNGYEVIADELRKLGYSPPD